MAIPAELKPLIAQVRQQHPELKDAPDEVVAQLIMRSLATHEGGALSQNLLEPDIERMSAEECGSYSEHLLATNRWREAERFLRAQVQKAERSNDLLQRCKATGILGLVCMECGDFRQAHTLFQQALALAERLRDRRLIGVTYNKIGLTYCRQGQYPQAIEHCLRSLEIGAEIGDPDVLVDGYGNLGIAYMNLGDFERARE